MSPATTPLDSDLPKINGRRNGLDSISKLILQILHEAAEPLETKDIENRCRTFDSKITRIKVFYRLQNLRAEGHLKGKFIGSGKGNWVWWLHSHNLPSSAAASKPQREPGAAESANGDIPNG